MRAQDDADAIEFAGPMAQKHFAGGELGGGGAAAKSDAHSPSATPAAQPELSVCIIGAGLAGLALARALQMSNRVSVVVFEKRSALEPALRSLVLTPGGLAAFQSLGLWEPFLAVRRLEKSSGSGEEDEASWALRADLLKVLAESLLPGTLKLGWQLGGLREAADGRLLCEFAPAGSAAAGPFDLVVGADGLLSRVRACAGSASPPLRRRLALLGDARRIFGREWDAGLSRIRGGANQALDEAMDLACQLLSGTGEGLTAAAHRRAVVPPEYSAELVVSWPAWLRHRYSRSSLGRCCRRRGTKRPRAELHD